MIPLGSSTTAISALFPWALVGIPLAGALLLYIYRKRGQTSERVVSSLFLLQHLPRSTPGKQYFVPPPQFWFELAAFIFLAGAAATLLLSNHGQHIAVIVDNSLSMGAIDDSGTSRLSKAKSQALSDLSQALNGARFSIFSQENNSLTPLSTRTISGTSAISTISGISQSFSSDSISTHLDALIGDQAGYDAVWVYTDHPLENSAPPRQVRVVTIQGDGPNRDKNIWISSISARSVDKGPQGDNASALSVTIKSSALPSQEKVWLQTTCFGASLSDRFELPDITATVSDSAPSTAEVIIPPEKNTLWSFCKVALSVQKPPTASSPNRLLLDDTAWITKNTSANTVQVISPLTPKQLGLEQVKTLQFSSSAASPSSATKTEKAIFHRTAPLLQSLSNSSLIAFPPPGELPFNAVSTPIESKDPLQITRWDLSHPILKYVNPTLLNLPIARKLECPDSSTPLLFSRYGALACAGEQDGFRYAIIGFELFPFDGKQNATLSIFTLNLFTWLFSKDAPTSAGSRFLDATTSLAPVGVLSISPAVTAAHYLAPLNEQLTISAEREIRPITPGIISLSINGDSESLTALNAISDEESRISHPAPLALSSSEAASITRKSKGSRALDLSPWIALLALVTLCGDLVRRIQRKQRWSASQ